MPSTWQSYALASKGRASNNVDKKSFVMMLMFLCCHYVIRIVILWVQHIFIDGKDSTKEWKMQINLQFHRQHCQSLFLVILEFNSGINILVPFSSTPDIMELCKSTKLIIFLFLQFSLTLLAISKC